MSLARRLLLRRLTPHLIGLRLLTAGFQGCLLLADEVGLRLLTLRLRGDLGRPNRLHLGHLLTRLICLRLLTAGYHGCLLPADEVGLRLLLARLGDRLSLLYAAGVCRAVVVVMLGAE